MEQKRKYINKILIVKQKKNRANEMGAQLQMKDVCRLVLYIFMYHFKMLCSGEHVVEGALCTCGNQTLFRGQHFRALLNCCVYVPAYDSETLLAICNDAAVVLAHWKGDIQAQQMHAHYGIRLTPTNLNWKATEHKI